ncbi:MBL fold metallo-hydrolase RNA specificity domain-containing protein [Vulcaniibacterium gelatinicum]|uniref:MBL fold metallo-hydrolase RNA specificity domain-containing protein n=1 Tax=Vulcaniibacterium gelatinicum TaxID=2598725 RepID=UPI0011C713A3|nr:MBL fold metallo-hydrolase [Vulcaniibacterium gelatinicum]
MATPSSSTLQFLGAAGTVTGSRYLVEAGGRRILVDCGLFQGYKQLRERNRAPFPVPPDTLDAVLLTHAHLDHSGYLPALVRDGFRGRVLCTPATRDLCALLLPDSAHLLEEEARYARKAGYSRHAEPTPLYTIADAEAALERFEPHDFERDIALAPGVGARFHPAGHLLGAAQIRLEVGGMVVHFSGDLGRPHDPLMRPPRTLQEADVLVCESTYGNRVHPRLDPEAELAPVIRRVAARGGVIVVPAFAVGRAQGVMLQIARLRQRGEIPRVPVFLNSPMAIDATDLYHRYHAEHHVSDAECQAMYELATMVRTVEESKALNRRHGPMIILSASGMLSGGRVLHHLEAFAPDPRNAIVLSGFQAGGTRGAALAGGADRLRMFGREVPIRAEVVVLQSFSGHADADELLAWMGGARRAPAATYVTHGEPDAADTLRGRIRRELGWHARVPEHMERISLDTPR